MELLTLSEFHKIIDCNKHHFDKLIEIVKSTGESLEGNCMYFHNSFSLLSSINNNYENKQRNIMSVAFKYNRLFEIGFNAGHSALLMLLSNPDLQLDSLDICDHKYTKLCFDYIQKQFPGRIRLIELNSLQIQEHLSRTEPYDVYHIDGNHEYNIANVDFFNCHEHAKKDSIIIWDDTQLTHIQQLWDGYKNDNHVEEIYSLPAEHVFGKVIK
jgi:hypothetical protein